MCVLGGGGKGRNVQACVQWGLGDVSKLQVQPWEQDWCLRCAAVPEMNSESGVEMEGVCTGGMCCIWEPPGVDSSVHTLWVVCRSRGSDGASPRAHLPGSVCPARVQ